MINVSSLRKISIVLSAIGLVDSCYLAWIKLANQEIMCADVGGCDVVNSSRYSEIGGIPIALIGAVAYLVILLLLLMDNRSDFLQENSALYVFGLSLVGTLYSVYLTYLEVEVINAVCPYCVLSAVMMLFIFILSIFRLRQVFE
jgi:uncharacterized membrane protein